MNTLTSSPVAPLLDRLFTEAEATDREVRAKMGSLPAADRDPANYRAFYGHARGHFLPVSRETGRLLYLLTRTARARAVVEFGTSFGISTVHLAAALRDGGGGRLIGSEFEPSKVSRAREHLALAGLADLVDIREGDALESLSRDLPDAIDLVLLDGAKVLYSRILDLLEPRLAKGALVIADNIDMCPDYVARVRDSRAYLSVPFAEDVEVSMRL